MAVAITLPLPSSDQGPFTLPCAQSNSISVEVLVSEGDKVKQGDNIAFYSALFGLIKKAVPSPRDGTIESASEVTGQVIVRGSPIPIEVDASLPGTIVTVVPREGVVVQTHGSFIQGIFGIGGEVHGEIKTITANNEEMVTPEKITPDCKGKVLIGGSLITLEAMRKAAEVGASALVVGGVRHQDLTNFTGQEIGVAAPPCERHGHVALPDARGRLDEKHAWRRRILEGFADGIGERDQETGLLRSRREAGGKVLEQVDASGELARIDLEFDERGAVTEGSSSNVFAVRGGRVTTPPLAAGILEGVTRGVVLRLAREIGVGADEAPLRPEDLEGADEVFITSSVREIVPVTRLGDRGVGTGRPGPVTRRLHDAFRRRAGGPVSLAAPT